MNKHMPTLYKGRTKITNQFIYAIYAYLVIHVDANLFALFPSTQLQISLIEECIQNLKEKERLLNLVSDVKRGEVLLEELKGKKK